MKKKISIVLVLAFIIGLNPGVAKAKLVACVGDSITWGWGLPNRASNCYPAQLATILQSVDSEWETQNFGVSSSTLRTNGNKPYVAQNAYNSALASEPDVVIIMLGTNDCTATSSALEQDFIPDYLALIDAFEQLPSHPKIFICYPPPIFGRPYGYSNTVMRDQIAPLIDQLPTYKEVQLIDLYTPLEESSHLFPDSLHPNTEGAKVMAEVVASVILGSISTPDFNGDEIVDIEDLIMLIEHWGQDEPSVDIVIDGIIDVQDLEVLMGYWQQEVLPVELVSYWKLDETEGIFAHDSAGENDAYLIGGPLWLPSGGQVDGALQLDGVDDCVITGSIPNPAKGSFSVLVWVKGGAPGQAVLSQMGGVRWLCADPSDGNLMTELKGAGRGANELLSQTVITDGNWHRIGLVWDGSNRTLYVDDVAVAEDTQTNLEASENGLYIGAGMAMEPGSYWSGLIDDVRIYNRAVIP